MHKIVTHVYTLLHKASHAITLAYMYYTLSYYLLHIMSFSITHTITLGRSLLHIMSLPITHEARSLHILLHIRASITHNRHLLHI